MDAVEFDIIYRAQPKIDCFNSNYFFKQLLYEFTFFCIHINNNLYKYIDYSGVDMPSLNCVVALGIH